MCFEINNAFESLTQGFHLKDYSIDATKGSDHPSYFIA